MDGKTIAIDARFLTRPMRGMPLYLFYLCKELPRLMPEVNFLLFINTGFEHNLPREKYQSVLDAIDANERVVWHDVKCSADPLWEQFLLPMALRRHRVDLLFMPANRRPCFSPCPTVVAVHDVIEYLFLRRFCDPPPGAGLRSRLYTYRHCLYLFLTYRLLLRRSEAIVTVSQHAESEIRKHLRIPANRITVIHHGLPDGYRLAKQSDSPPFSERGFCLMLGGDGYQKNPEGALAAWAAVPAEVRRQHPLRIVGFMGDSQSPAAARFEPPRPSIRSARGFVGERCGVAAVIQKRGGIHFPFPLRRFWLSLAASHGRRNPLSVFRRGLASGNSRKGRFVGTAG